MKYRSLAFVLVMTFGLGATSASYAKDILETAADAGTFTILLAAVKAAGLTPVFTEKGPLTLFAPTDDAFTKLPKNTLEGLFRPENKDKLKELLAHHLVMGKVTTADFLGKRLEAVTADGGSVLIDATHGITVDDAKMVRADIVADNGFIHVVDTVIIPK